MAIYGLQQDVQANPDKNVNLFVPGKTQLTPQDVFLGGQGTGVDDSQLNGATRVFGDTAQGTRSALNHYEGDLASQIKAAQATNAAPRVDANIGMPTIQRQQMEINQAQNAIDNPMKAAALTGKYQGLDTLAQKTFDHGVSQDNFTNGINIGQLTGEYNGSPTLSKQAQAIQDAQFKATQAQNESQFGRSLSIQQQNANTSAGIYPNVSSSPYSSSINKYASQYGVPANLIDAVIGQESGGNSNATSSAGASGLMQLMPDTAKSLGVTDTSNVDQSIMGGTKYLSQQLSKYGSTELALAAYNAGPGAVDNAIKQAGSTSWDAVSKYLPSETQSYVPSVIGSVKTSSGKVKAPTASEIKAQYTSAAYSDIQSALDKGTSPDVVKQNILSHSGDYASMGINPSTLTSQVDAIVKSWGDSGNNPNVIRSDASSAWNSLNNMWKKQG